VFAFVSYRLFDQNVGRSPSKQVKKQKKKKKRKQKEKQKKSFLMLILSPAADYCCPQCKHGVVPEKWSVSSGLGLAIAKYLKQFDWGKKLLPTPPPAIPQPSTPLRAAMLGAANETIIGSTPKTRSRKPGETEVRVVIEGDEDEDKYAAKSEGRMFTKLRIFIFLMLFIVMAISYSMFFYSKKVGGGSNSVEDASVTVDVEDDDDDE
jgi:hypothetical protein